MITAEITFLYHTHTQTTKVIKSNCLREREKLSRCRCFEFGPWYRKVGPASRQINSMCTSREEGKAVKCKEKESVLWEEKEEGPWEWG